MTRQLAVLLVSVFSVHIAYAMNIPEMERTMREDMQNPTAIEYKSLSEVTNSAGKSFICGNVSVIEASGQKTDSIPFAYAENKTIYVSPALSKNDRSEYRLTGFAGKEIETSWYKTLKILDTNCLAGFETLAVYFSEGKSDEISVAAGIKIWDDFNKKAGKKVDAEFNKSAYYYLRSILYQAQANPEMGEAIKAEPATTRTDFLINCHAIFIDKGINE
ncbi:hypothetical protein ABQG65_08715 [Yersinia alsatica]|uniref:hypothetical protein n=1 Tax=Yersinia alsatica TaxID=2890317 RepID=UPI0032ECEFE0